METNGLGGWFTIRRPARYWDVVFAHLPLAAVSGITLGLAAFLPAHWSLHRACTFLSLTSYPCIFCGGTRAFRAMAHGQWGQAFIDSPFAAALFIFTAIVLIWNLAGLVSGVHLRMGERLRLKAGRGKFVAIAIVTLFVINWMYRLAMGFD